MQLLMLLVENDGTRKDEYTMSKNVNPNESKEDFVFSEEALKELSHNKGDED